jgi:ribonucleoside-triphosphate reductase
LTFDESEVGEVQPLLRAFDGQLKSISMLPLSDVGAYRQMPYEKISEERYEELASVVRPIDWEQLYAGNALDAVGESGCTNDRCELPG